MVTIAEWAEWAASQARNMRSHFPAQNELSAILTNVVRHPGSPLARATIAIEARGVRVLTVEAGGGDAAPIDVSAPLHDAEDATVRISAVLKLAPASTSVDDQHEISNTLVNLADSYWNGRFRDSHAQLPWRSASGFPPMIEASVPLLSESCRYLCCLFADIDGFHEINRQVGQSRGDQILGYVGRTIAAATGPTGLAIRLGGDEFVALVGVNSREDALGVARRLMEGVSASLIDGVAVRISVGLALVDAGAGPESIDGLFGSAERALIRDGEKRRGVARLAPSRERVLPQDLDLWLCQVTAGASQERPSNNAWLNLLSSDVAAAVAEAHGNQPVSGVVGSFLNWAHPVWVGDLGVESSDSEPTLSRMEVALATAHGILRGGLAASSELVAGLRIAHNPSMDSVELRQQDVTEPLLALGPPLKDERVVSVVDQLYTTVLAGAGQVDCRRVVLLAVGRDPLPVPAEIFREVIRVDDRPTRQGGLPDFWAAAVAQLVTRCERSPNVTSVLVLGDPTNARETIRWIEDRRSWPEHAERLTGKTGVTARALETAARRLSDLTYCRSREELLAALHLAQRTGGDFTAESNPIAPSLRRVLHREVGPEAFRLPDTAGCRVDRVADAYPVVLDRLRSADRSVFGVRDEAGHDLVEFRDFVVRVDSIEAERVPLAYLGDREDLESYYKAQFVEVGGTFTEKLDSQARVVIEGLRSSLEKAPTSTTRRALLVVPHDVSAGEMNPLGLIAIRIAPRPAATTVRLDFSFVWRTVEAVVGLPYSLYGSARYSQDLRDRLDGILTEAVELGSLTYLAMSLHMGLDDYSQQVARRVVEDASA